MTTRIGRRVGNRPRDTGVSITLPEGVAVDMNVRLPTMFYADAPRVNGLGFWAGSPVNVGLARLTAERDRQERVARGRFYAYAAAVAHENLRAYRDTPAALLSASLSGARALVDLGTLPWLDVAALRPEFERAFDGRVVTAPDIERDLAELASRYPEEA